MFMFWFKVTQNVLGQVAIIVIVVLGFLIFMGMGPLIDSPYFKLRWPDSHEYGRRISSERQLVFRVIETAQFRLLPVLVGVGASAPFHVMHCQETPHFGFVSVQCL